MQSFTKFAGLDGLVALVTGGATGIGSAIVENFLRQGVRVVFLDKNEEAGRELVARLTEGAKTIPEFICAELTDLHSTAKAAIEGLTRGLARTLGPRNIRINCVVPGCVRTRRQVERWLTPELEQVILDGQCLKRLVEPEDVAKMVAFLASEDAQSCTNQTFVIDAGWL
jgi:NAD(P)-dependent dehydrogenase (short-subunit alcohol dehydrogenase family)